MGDHITAADNVAWIRRLLMRSTRPMTTTELALRTGLTVHNVNKMLARNPHWFERAGKDGHAILWKAKGV